MKFDSIIGKEKQLFTYMKEHGYPVFHKSNIFLRDIQFGVRDFYRANSSNDIGSRKSDEFAGDLIRDLTAKGKLLPFSNGVWILNMEEFLLPKKEEPAKAE